MCPTTGKSIFKILGRESNEQADDGTARRTGLTRTRRSPGQPRSAASSFSRWMAAHLLEDGNGERSRLSSARLGLGDDIVAFDDGNDSALLDSRGSLETGCK